MLLGQPRSALESYRPALTKKDDFDHFWKYALAKAPALISIGTHEGGASDQNLWQAGCLSELLKNEEK